VVYPEAATRMFDRAMSLLGQGNWSDALTYLQLSLEYEPRPLTHLEEAKVRFARGWLETCEKSIDAGLQLCTDSSSTADLIAEFTELSNRLTPLLELERELANKKEGLGLQFEALGATGQAEEALHLTDLTAYHGQLLKLAARSTRLVLKANKISDGVCSRFGGVPEAPADFDWPLSETGVPLSFLCQLALSDLKNYYAGTLLPTAGLLSFFYDDDTQTGGFAPGEYSNWRVFLFPQVDVLGTPEVPRLYPRYREFDRYDLSFEDDLSFPSSASREIQDLGMSPAKIEIYEFFCDHWHRTSKPVHHLFGHPQLIQNDWKEECLWQLVQNCALGDVPAKPVSEIPKALGRMAEDWRLLLQIDSGDLTGMEWGDSGRLYFCIEGPALKSGDFSRVWTVMQCY
jgi:uncharacterized protein YwqG